jgi:hypothetical protein
METISWELLVAAGAVLFGQGGVLAVGRRYLINGLGEDVHSIKQDTKAIIENQHAFDLRLTIIEQDVLHLKDEC